MSRSWLRLINYWSIRNESSHQNILSAQVIFCSDKQTMRIFQAWNEMLAVQSVLHDVISPLNTDLTRLFFILGNY